MYVLGLSNSPRRGGNTDTLLDKVLEGAASVGAEVEKVWVPGLKIAGCLECNGCYETEGKCVVQDDFQQVYQKYLKFDRLVFATPVFFMNVSAQAKAVIDRCQCLYVLKYVLKKRLFPEGRKITRKGMLLSLGGSRVKGKFEAARMTMKYFFDALEAEYAGDITASSIDAKGEVLKHSDLLELAFQRGIELAQVDEGGGNR